MVVLLAQLGFAQKQYGDFKSIHVVYRPSIVQINGKQYPPYESFEVVITKDELDNPVFIHFGDIPGRDFDLVAVQESVNLTSSNCSGYLGYWKTELHLITICETTDGIQMKISNSIYGRSGVVFYDLKPVD